MTCALYRHFDADGVLLYVGISLSAVQRLSQHSASPWSDRIARVDVERFPSREAAERAEREAIQTERPKHNATHAIRERDAHESPATAAFIAELDDFIRESGVSATELGRAAVGDGNFMGRLRTGKTNSCTLRTVDKFREAMARMRAAA